RTVAEIAAYIGVDSLGYLSTTGLGRAIASANEEHILEDAAADTALHSEFCYGCMDKQGWPFDPVGTRFIMPSRLPEPQARTQSVGSRHTDPASSSLARRPLANASQEVN